MAQAHVLDFRRLDELAMAEAEGLLDRLTGAEPFSVTSLGPLIEWLELAAGNRLPDPIRGEWLRLNGAAPLVAALRSGQGAWLAPRDERLGFARLRFDAHDPDMLLTRFFMAMKRAAMMVSGLPKIVAGQLSAALREMKGNIIEHSSAKDSGLLLYRAAPGVFEFVATDRGIGILTSLKSSTTFAALDDHGEALLLALQEGVSRFDQTQGRGFGFRTLFLGLLHLNGTLRFRSGDYALLMDGTSPELSTAQLVQKTYMKGFFVSVRIHAADI